MALTLSFSTNVQAAGETGHSDLSRLLAAIFGLNIQAADYLATVNQSVDKVPLSAATQSGRASAKLHFATVVTQSDLDEKDLEKLLKNNGNRTFLTVLGLFFKNNTMGGGVASLGNAEAAEALGKAMKKGDGVLYAMGLHYLLDTAAPFHDGYLGALSNPIPLVNKLPFFHKFAFGHLTDGTSTDKLSIGKIIIAMDAMGPFLITLRESQKNDIGVNTQWLNYLKSQGVDVNSVESIRNWFMAQPYVKEILQKNLPANQSLDYSRMLVEEVKDRVQDLEFFNDQKYLDEKMSAVIDRVEELRNVKDTKITINNLIFDFVDQAWRDGKLNEKTVIAETTTDYFGAFEGTEKLTDLIYDSKYEGLPDYAQDAVASQLKQKSSHPVHSREWIVDQIVAKITREMISQSWEKFNTAYLNEKVEGKQIEVEARTIGNIEKHFFNRTGKYSYNPRLEHWMKVFSNWRALSKEERGDTLLKKVITFCDLVVTTKIYDGKEVHSLPASLKATIFIKTMAYIFHEEFRNPITTSGNFAVKISHLRQRMIEQLKREFPEGLITEKMLKRSQAYNELINRKFNSGEAVGPVQKTAQAIKAGAEYLQSLGARKGIRCEGFFVK